ncbi:hypothetical protein IAG44_39615 [Streptomyces roseirectus]|uniref:Uncharacterized protein n=1 Tax=Streptomyces roseirectus TaxID=2768066 RepID=A0A7H0IQ66_9ACTN|nr:hypothetical protein [Streptomyces roseirectus]QNP74932.1 hypothetical protein IAG44_39615 [Streptomyces roseirectus]
MQDLDPTTVADRDHPAVGAADKIGVGLNIEHDRAFVAGGHVEDVAPSTPNSSPARGHHRADGDGTRASTVRVLQEKQLGRR